MIDYYLRYDKFPGIGAQIILLSTLLDTKQKINIIHRQINKSFVDLVRIFNISPDKINFTIDATAPCDNNYLHRLNDCSKFFSPYLTYNTVNVLGQQVSLQTNRTMKRYIAVCYANGDNGLPPGKNLSNDPPFNRYHNKEFWINVVDLIISAGYEVITINTLTTSLDDKIYQLVKFCDAVITYEGGIAHLAHCLKIPTIIMPWRTTDFQDAKKIPYYEHSLHIDTRTWFLKDHTEILNYSVEDLRSKIDSLYNEAGNNFFLSNKCKLNKNTRQLEVVDTGEILKIGFSQFELEFISKYITHE